MQAKPAEVKATSGGEWIVTTTESGFIALVQSNTNKTIAVFGREDDPKANEHIANAALCSVARDMLDLLIEIQQTVINPETDAVTDIITINDGISAIFSKLANEAGEEL